MKKLTIILLILIGVIIGFLIPKVDISALRDLAPQSCTYKGRVYEDGEGFKDDCNTCTCQNGQVACTLIACE